MATPKKKAAAKPASKATPIPEPVKVERSSRVVTEIYAWTSTIHLQGTDLRYLEFVGTDGKVGFRIMNINPEVAAQLAGMLVPPEPSEA